MTVKKISLLLWLGCLSFLSAGAQSPAAPAENVSADSSAFEQGRLRIWCETTRFVYEDNGADSLLPSLNCQTWESLRAAMNRTDGSLGVLRLMNSVDKPAIYQGFSTDEAKLQKLVGEISTKLKQSPVRRSNISRLNKVDSLQQQLMLLVRQVDPASMQAEADGAMQRPLPEEEYEPALEAEEGPATQPTTGLPWNELLQWLLLLTLTGLALWRMREYEQRHRRMKREFRELEQQVNSFIINSTQAVPPPAARKSLSEAEVRNLILEELQQERTHKEAPVAKAANLPKAKPAPSPLPSTADALQTAPDPGLSEPSLPPAAPLPQQEKPSELFYDKMPFRGGFHEHELSKERQRDSLYTLRLGSTLTGEADYWITEDPEIQRYAMQNGMSFFEEGCEFSQVDENPSRVVNEQKGKLRKEGSVWKIVQKAVVRFE